MAITPVPGQLWWPSWPLRVDSDYTIRTSFDLVLDAADEAAALIFQAPKDGNISKLAFKLGVVTTGATVDVRLETVSTTTGMPTGTLATTNSNGSLAIDASDDYAWKEVTLTASHTAAAGDVLALVVVNPSSSFGDFAFSTILEVNYYLSIGFPYSTHYTGSWGDSTYGMNGAVGYDDGTFPALPGLNPWGGTSSTVGVSFSNASDPDHRGAKFKFPVGFEIDAFYVYVDLDGDCDLKLYDSDGSTVLWTTSFDKDMRPSVGECCVFFPMDPQELAADTWYRLVLEPTSTTPVSVNEVTVTEEEPTYGGANWLLTTKKDGAWTDTQLTKPTMGVRISGIESGGGGLLTHPGMSGGMRG